MKPSLPGPATRPIAALVLLSFLFFFFNLGAYSLKEPDEGRYAEIPREMVESGDWLVPHLDYVRYFEKPPLLYWTVALSYKVFGINEWAFRFPNALFALMTVLSLYIFARKWFPEQVAFLSSVILMSAFGFFSMARIETTDMLFTFWLFLSLLSFYDHYRQQHRGMLSLFYISLALATLTKGPVAILLMVLAVLPFLLIERRLSFLKELHLPWGVPLFLLVAAPWFIAISLKEKQFFSFFFIDQHLLRFLTEKHKRTGPIYYFLPVLFGGLFPWSLLIPRSVVALWRRSELTIFFLWSLVIFLFFSLSKSKLPPYILPLFPSVSLILGYFFQKEWDTRRIARPEKITYFVVFCLFASAAFLFSTSLLQPLINRLLPGPPFAPPDHMTRLALLMGVASSLCALTLLFLRARLSLLFVSLGLFSLVIVTVLTLHTETIDAFNSTKHLSAIINGYGAEAEYVVNYGSFEESVPFYTHRRVYMAAYSGELQMGSEYPDAKAFFLSEDAFARLMQSKAKVFVILKAKRVQKLQDLGLTNVRTLACQGEKCLIRN